MPPPRGTDRADVVVIGSGHNGLVAACYLARAGLTVEVVESDDVLGGAVSTVERWPGVRVDRGSSAHVIIRQSGIVEDLDLAAHGLRYIDCDPWGFAPAPSPGAPGPEGRPLVFSVDLDATCASIAAACGPDDAAAYREFVTVWSRRTRAVAASFGRRPTPAGLIRSFWPMGAPSGGRPRTPGERPRGRLPRLRRRAPGPVVQQRTAVRRPWRGSGRSRDRRCPSPAPRPWWGGPPSCTKYRPATPSVVRGDSPQHCGGDWRPMAAGSPSGTAPSGCWSRTDGPSGWRRRPDDGSAPTPSWPPARSASPATSPAPTPRPRWPTRIRRSGTASASPGDAVPTYPGIAGTVCPPAGLSRRDDRRDWRLRRTATGRPGGSPGSRSRWTRFLGHRRHAGPAGEQHVVTIWGQWYPYDLADGADWDALAETEAARLVAAVDRYAPGFAESVQRLYVQTPLALERELSLPRGNVMHVEMGLASMFGFRPTPALSGYTVPGLPGLYLAGASTHPGGGVSGHSGWTAARVLLADRRARARARRSLGAVLRRTIERVRR